MEKYDELLWQLVDLVKETSPRLWEIAVRQVYVQATIAGVRVLITGTIAFLFLWATIKCIKNSQNEEEYHEDTGAWGVVSIFAGVIALVFFGVSADYLTEVLGYLINPEYYAIDILINLVKQSTN